MSIGPLYRNPSSVNASDTYKPCLGEYGGPVDPNVALGGFPSQFIDYIIAIILIILLCSSQQSK